MSLTERRVDVVDGGDEVEAAHRRQPAQQLLLAAELQTGPVDVVHHQVHLGVALIQPALDPVHLPTPASP